MDSEIILRCAHCKRLWCPEKRIWEWIECVCGDCRWAIQRMGIPPHDVPQCEMCSFTPVVYRRLTYQLWRREHGAFDGPADRPEGVTP